MNYFDIYKIERQIFELMQECGLAPIENISLQMDGLIHRYKVAGDRGSETAGAYCIFLEHWPAGWICNWRTGVLENFCFKRDGLTEEGRKYFDDNAKVKAAIEASREHQKKLQEELRLIQLRASDDARARFETIKDYADPSHPYLQNKHVNTYGLKLLSGSLVVPLRDVDGKFLTYQLISEDGDKKFFPNASTKGAFFSVALDTLVYDKDNKVPILICEGYATAATVYELTGFPTVAAMNCHNLQLVGEALKAKYKGRKFIFLADNDTKTDGNPGLTKANDANKKLGFNGVIAPEFSENEDGSDWNDFYIIHGEDFTRELLLEKIHIHSLPLYTQNLIQKVETINAQKLRHKVFAPLKWAVDGFLPAGLSILVGGPKIGKSILALHLAIAVAIGGCALGKIFVQQGDVLYLALEDTQRRLQERIDGSDLLEDADLSRLDIVTQIPRQHEGGLDYLKYWLDEHKGARLVIIDTLQKFRKQLSGKNSMYSEDYDVISEIKKVADDHDVPILIIHHVKKLSDNNDWINDVSGSQGISGAADTIFAIKRARTESGAILHRTGRDVEEKDFALKLDGFGWTLQGDATLFTMPEWKRQVIDYLKEHNSVTAVQLSEVANITLNTAQQNLRRLAKERLIKKTGYGTYSLEE